MKKILSEMYFYRDTVIAVRPGLGNGNWATCRRKGHGGWTAVKSWEMPRVSDRWEADINFRVWAESKHHKRADCGSCPDFRAEDGFCSCHGWQLEKIEITPGQEPAYIKHKNCNR